ncbi:hypothetical protein VTJ04DRAFT_508 [Mycothermus thermophilus]|uniref:uncharacterized protein n=1 Tax=Humicola insolens TaxID=85995 RepID=UPI003742962E
MPSAYEDTGGGSVHGTHRPVDDRARQWLGPALHIPKNKSTGNLLTMADRSPDSTRIRFSFDAATEPAEHDTMLRSGLTMDDDHGLGMSGLRRIRQQNPMRVPTLPSSSQAPSPKALPRSASVTVLMDHAMSLSPGPTSPTFTEDLSRFPSESLHSFSFAHADDMIHGRQKMLKLKRSMEYLRDPQMGLWTGASPLNIDVPPRTSSPDPIDKTSGGPSAASTPLGIQKADGEVPTVITADSTGSENSSRTPTNESGVSGTTTQTSPPASRRPSILKRTMTDTDTATVSIQQRLMDVMGQRFLVEPSSSQEPPRGATQAVASTLAPASAATQTIHNPSSSRWVPTHQAIFTTQSKPPWTILAANDLACLMFGVTTAEVRKMGIMELVQEERREWLAKKLQKGSRDDDAPDLDEKTNLGERLLGARAGGVTGKLLSKPNSRAQKSSRRPATVHSGDPKLPKAGNAHRASKSRGVLLCGDVVPIQKRNGATGAATFWVIEKRTGLIWVLEEIHEDLAILDIDEEGTITKISGALGPIWGNEHLKPGLDIGTLIPRISRQGIDPRFGALDYREIARIKYYTCLTSEKVSIPVTVEQVRGSPQLRVSSFPHIAGIIVVDPEKLTIKSSNSVFCGALFGHEKADGLHITRLVPNFDKILRILTEKEGINLVEGVVVPEHSFRKAAVLLALEQGNPDAAAGILGPQGLPAKHRDGSPLKIDIQMRVVQSEKQVPTRDKSPSASSSSSSSSFSLEDSSDSDSSDSESSNSEAADTFPVPQTETVYALWITYSRHLHSRVKLDAVTPLASRTPSPPIQPVPEEVPVRSPVEPEEPPQKVETKAAPLANQIKEAVVTTAKKVAAASSQTPSSAPKDQSQEKPSQVQQQPSQQQVTTTTTKTPATKPTTTEPRRKKTINDFVILEEMGQGAYGQVKLARHIADGKKCVLKYVTKRRILVDTWTRDRRLGTVPLEIHVLDYLRRDGLKHPNIVEMVDFFEDEINYYIEMVPHGLPGMDLFDYIELRTNMEEAEARSIFVQVVRAVHHLHTVAGVVHRDIKDENVVLDGEGRVKLIDFGSAAYIKSGPFEMFVGTIDYAAPEVLAGKPYGGKEQDVWALGILLYTIIYKENPFYSIDEIMDRDLRIPHVKSEESIDLIRKMLNRDVKARLTIEQVLEHPWFAMEG